MSFAWVGGESECGIPGLFYARRHKVDEGTKTWLVDGGLRGWHGFPLLSPDNFCEYFSGKGAGLQVKSLDNVWTGWEAVNDGARSATP